MPTYTITQFKTRTGEILDSLNAGEEVIITRRGKPCAKLTAMPEPAVEKRSLRSLRGILATNDDDPGMDFDELQAYIKGLWKNFGTLPEEEELQEQNI